MQLAILRVVSTAPSMQAAGRSFAFSANGWHRYTAHMFSWTSFELVRRSGKWALGVGLALAAFSLFAPSIRYELVDLDDLTYVTQNQIVLNGLAIPSIRAAFATVWQGMWAPVLWLSYMLDVQLFGHSAWGLHLTNVLLHAANAFLLYALFLCWSGKPWRAAFAAALWALHPLRVESVAWVAERKDVLSGLFFLLCLLAYSAAHGHGRPGAHCHAHRRPLLGAALCFLALGLMVKPMLVTTPFLLLLLDIWPLGRARLDFPNLIAKTPKLLAEKWGFWLAAAASSLIAYFAHAAAGAVQATPLVDRLKTVPLHYAFYLLKTARPRNLTVLYDGMLFTRRDGLLALAILGGITAWALLDARRRTHELVGWAWFLGTFVPVIGLVRFGVQSIADRFTYLPAIGLSLMLLHALPGIKSRALRAARAIAAGGILLWLAVLSARQLPMWNNSDALYDRVLQFSPSNSFGIYHRATRELRAGRPAEAEALLAQNILNHPDAEIFQQGKALAMMAQGRAAEAFAWLTALPLPQPSSCPGYREWTAGLLAFSQERYEEAASLAETALRIMPPNDNTRTDVLFLGMAAYFLGGDPDNAARLGRQWPPFRDKRQLAPEDLLPFYLKQWIGGQRQLAMDFFRRLLPRMPNDVLLHNNLAWLLATAEWSPADPQEVVVFAETALSRGGIHPILLSTLAAACANAGDFPSAAAHAEKALAMLRASGQDHSELFDSLQSQLRSYRQNRPWRDNAAAQRILKEYREP